ncbi:MAG TPA: hypothetical protein VGJ26_20320 [Pirellulales bacterium]
MKTTIGFAAAVVANPMIAMAAATVPKITFFATRSKSSAMISPQRMPDFSGLAHLQAEE